MKNIINSESGQGLSEYALILSLIVVAAIMAVTGFGNHLHSLYQDKVLGVLP